MKRIQPETWGEAYKRRAYGPPKLPASEQSKMEKAWKRMDVAYYRFSDLGIRTDHEMEEEPIAREQLSADWFD